MFLIFSFVTVEAGLDLLFLLKRINRFSQGAGNALHWVRLFFLRCPVATLHIIYSTSTGHTEHVVDTVIDALKTRVPGLNIEKQRAEKAQAADLLRGDALLLASGTWNTGGSEGQLHPYMYVLLRDRARDCDLQKKPCALIALGDDRYYYTARAMEHLMQFVLQHGGQAAESLVIINEPYGQEEKMQKWAEKLLSKIPALAT